ncbi:MAG TPA: TrmH family RNA methyltransferase, partial [Jatrophihabitans sp.]|nr:TrmH family RNA methyltransferase [Jatrophihabitans sp.]
PFAVLAGWPGSLSVLRLRGYRLLALTPDVTATPLPEVAIPARWAAMFGAEGPGLSAAALAAADEQVRIPMAAGVDSLNVATAAAVTFAHLSG